MRPGDLGENITTVGLDLECLPLGTLLRLGASATLELTGLRTPCVLIDRFKSGLKNRLQGKPAGPRFYIGTMKTRLDRAGAKPAFDSAKIGARF